MTASEILTQAKAAGLNLWLEKRDGVVGINFSDPGKVKPFIKAIKADRAEVVRLLKMRLPKVPDRRVPGAITLQFCREWLDLHQSQSKSFTAPTRLRWLVGWLPPDIQLRWQYQTDGGLDGKLAVADWRVAVDAVWAEFEANLKGGAI
jgi:hypothetical protein|tara:strand:+ start:4272 stop:4715 length:444 start_codon:yes stop_codon:yes gene_type:complete